jgi:hypothetical protein
VVAYHTTKRGSALVLEIKRESQKFFSGQGRNDDSHNTQLNVSARNFGPQNEMRSGDIQPYRTEVEAEGY